MERFKNAEREAQLNSTSSDNKCQIEINCDYFSYVYRTAYSYIKSNAKRGYGAGSLNLVKHPKLLAAMMLCHLSEQGIKESPGEQESYRTRSVMFIKGLMKIPALLNTRSQDTRYLSFKTCLDSLASYEVPSLEQYDDQLNAFYNRVNESINKLSNTLDHLNDHLLLFFSEQESIDYKGLLQNKEKGVLSSPLLNKIIHNTTVANLLLEPIEKKDGELFNGLDYKITDETPSFLIKKLSEEGRKNLILLLQKRDRLTVVYKEMAKLQQFANNDVKNFHFYLKYLEPYLREVAITKGEMEKCFDILIKDTRAIYLKRSEDVNMFGLPTTERKQWEFLYFNKNAIENYRDSMASFSNQLNEVFGTIPRNFIPDIENKIENGNEIVNKSDELFKSKRLDPKSFDFHDSLMEIKWKEVERQALLIEQRQSILLQEYNELISVLTGNNQDRAIALVKGLTKRKEALNMLITKTNPLDAIEEIEGADQEELIRFLDAARDFCVNEEQTKIIEGLNDKIKELIELKDDLASKNKEHEKNKQKNLEKEQQLQAQITIDKCLKPVTDSFIFSNKSSMENNACLRTFFKERCVTESQATQAANLFANLENVFNDGTNITEAYCQNAAKENSSFWFFKHRQSGKNNANLVMNEWKKELKLRLNKTIKQHFKTNENQPKDEQLNLTLLAQQLNGIVRNSIITLIGEKEKKSNVEAFSFNNYLRAFYNNNVLKKSNWLQPLADKKDVAAWQKEVESLKTIPNCRAELKAFKEKIKLKATEIGPFRL